MGRRCGRALLAAGLLAGSGLACNEGDTITTPTLGVTCTATPAEGAAPLEVAFALTVSGAEGQMSVAISYGDGSSGTDPDAHHTYEEAGVYTASFTVTSRVPSGVLSMKTTPNKRITNKADPAKTPANSFF